MADFVTLLLMAVWLMLPAYVANMAPVFAARFGFVRPLAQPVDFGIRIGGEPLFGSHKTWRGFVVGSIAAVVTIWFQSLLFPIDFFNTISLLSYTSINIALYGLLLGFGALMGDLVKSFFKRRMKIPSGVDWHPFDEIDFVIGALVLLSFIFKPPFAIVIFALAVSPLLHIAANRIGHKTGMKK